MPLPGIRGWLFRPALAGAVAALLSVPEPAYAERRVALVIGNDRYVNLPADRQLQKAVNDAHTVESVYPGRAYTDTALSKLLVNSEPAR
jgi:hypothetical protein